MKVTAGENDAGRRLDRVLRRVWSNAPLSHIHKELRRGAVQVNGKRRRGGYRVQAGDVISVPSDETVDSGSAAAVDTGPAAGSYCKAAKSSDSAPSPFFESPHITAYSKPRGLPTIGENSLEERLRPELLAKAESSLSFRPGPLHRLDRNTTGIVLFSKSLAGAHRFTELQNDGEISKVYLGILDGRVENAGVWNAPLQRLKQKRKTVVDARGKECATWYHPVAWRPGPALSATLCFFVIHTGFTHQIRAHAASAGFPLLGDRKYRGRPFAGPGAGPSGYFLHACAIRLSAEDAVLGFRLLALPPPPSFLAAAREIFGEKVAESVATDRRLEGVISTTLEE